jgi:predicted DNA-binding transcriptional regulator AlpA
MVGQSSRKIITYTAHPIPEMGFVRLPSILAVFPVSKATWLAGVKTGRYPKPVKLAARTTAWRAEDIRLLISSQGGAA